MLKYAYSEVSRTNLTVLQKTIMMTFLKSSLGRRIILNENQTLF